MSFKIARCLRTLVKSQNIACVQHKTCQYSRWSSRRPSKVTLPFREEDLTSETVVDLGAKYDFQDLKRKQKVKKEKVVRAEEADASDDEVSASEEEEAAQGDGVPLQKVSKNRHKKSSRFDYNKINELCDFEHVDQPRKKAASKQETLERVKSVFDEDGDFIYEKLGDNDPNISSLIIKLKSSKFRGSCGQILVEGWRLVAEGLLAGSRLTHLVVSRPPDLMKLRPFLPQEGPLIYKMPYREMQSWSNLETSPGVMGIFDTPKIRKCPAGSFPITIICDNIREPGNLGAVLRGAMGVGCQKVILTKGCVDLWDSKVLRSAAGAHFHIPVAVDQTWREISSAVPSSCAIFIADNKLGVGDNYQPTARVVKKKIPANYYSRSQQNQLLLEDENVQEFEENVNPEDIPLLPYFAVDYTNVQSIALVIGGETEGISASCYRFGIGRDAARLNIPLMSGVDSLNTGSALAVIAFEMKRQLLQGKRPTQTQQREEQSATSQ